MAEPPSATRIGGAVAAFRAVAFFEAVSYLALLVAVLIYRVFDGPDYVGVLGPIHGVAFLIYLFLVLQIRTGQGWDLWRTLIVILASAVPFGGFWAGSHLKDEPRAGAGSDAGPGTGTGASRASRPQG